MTLVVAEYLYFRFRFVLHIDSLVKVDEFQVKSFYNVEKWSFLVFFLVYPYFSFLNGALGILYSISSLGLCFYALKNNPWIPENADNSKLTTAAAISELIQS